MSIKTLTEHLLNIISLFVFPAGGFVRSRGRRSRWRSAHSCRRVSRTHSSTTDILGVVGFTSAWTSVSQEVTLSLSHTHSNTHTQADVCGAFRGSKPLCYINSICSHINTWRHHTGLLVFNISKKKNNNLLLQFIPLYSYMLHVKYSNKVFFRWCDEDCDWRWCGKELKPLEEP